MRLPPGFQFSQASLQDYVDCRKRFYLRHVLRLAWPAPQVEPALENERIMQLGSQFHRLVQQSVLGMPEERLARLIQEDDLQRWWRNYQAQDFEASDSARRYPEVSLSAELGGFTLDAKCDLVQALPGGRLQLFDWKTSRKRTPRPTLLARLQTRVYPYLLVRDGAWLNGGAPVRPEQVEMVYWFADFPAQPERIPYDSRKFQADEAYLRGLMDEITRLEEPDFYKTARLELDRFCVYRSLCDRGVEAGRVDELDDLDAAPAALDFDFDQVAEVEY